MHYFDRLDAAGWRNLVGEDARCVVEAGSHDGSDTEMLLEAFPQATIHCFEPADRPRARAQERLGDNPRVVLRPEAIADHLGVGPWYASHGSIRGHCDEDSFPEAVQDDWDLSGSILEPTGHWETHSWLRFEKEDVVPTISLNFWKREHPEIGCVDLLWADIQGAELLMLKGGQRVLEITRYLYAEVYDLSLTPRPEMPEKLYEGQPCLKEIVEALPGWTCLGYYNGDTMLFRNDNAPTGI